MSVILRDPDTFVQWTRTDEPGDDPTWTSQCGKIVQYGLGHNAMFHGFVGPEQTPTDPKSVLMAVKKDVERAFQKTRSLAWSYGDDD